MKRIKNRVLNFPEKLLGIILIVVVGWMPKLTGQTLCDYDGCLNSYLSQNPQLSQQMSINEQILQNEMNNDSQAIMNDEVYTIPVVFHILHRGEPIGDGSNISNNQILQALSDLNTDFRNLNGTGFDVGIQFCLAQQDPNGNSQYDPITGLNITGIRRADASQVPNFESYGIWTDVNEVAAKSLSNWPEHDYINVWVAHKLYVGQINVQEAYGFAYFPVAGDDVDGVALRSDITGLPHESKVITHEFAHFFRLHHTFRAINNCPVSSSFDCNTDGDMICETRSHPRIGNYPFPCPESLYTYCDPTYNEPYFVSENHMNYTGNDCRDEFVPSQIVRMRCTLMSLRSSLLSSIGCEPSCENGESQFVTEPDNNVLPVGSNVSFINNSYGGFEYQWTIDGDLKSSSENWNYTFEIGGNYNVCLDIIGQDDCVDRYCQELSILPNCVVEDSECELIQNGDFEQIESDSDINNFESVCGWVKVQSSPFFCNLDNNSIGLFFEDTTDIERITTEQPLDLIYQKSYNISFDYLVTAINRGLVPPKKLIFALTDNNNYNPLISQPLESSAQIIAELDNLSAAYGNQMNNSCYKEGENFEHFEATFVCDDVTKNYLTITGIGDYLESVVFIDNVSINVCEISECTPLPDFTYDEDCPREFIGTNAGDGDSFTWDFLCENISMSGQNVTIDLPPGTCEVCLTIACDFETSSTKCKTVVIPDNTKECPEACIDMKVPLHTCQQNQGEENTYVSNLSLSVPDGTLPCGNLLSQIVGVNTSYDYTIEDDATMDIINIAIEMTTPPNFDLSTGSFEGFINLCTPNGQILCYNLLYIVDECDNCLGEITATATCADTNPADSTYLYQGSATIQLSPIDDGQSYSECPSTSTEVGYDQTVVITNNEAVVDFSITTTEEGIFSPSTLLCFNHPIFGQICYTLNITIDPCNKPDCVEWNKITNVTDCTVSDDGITYNIDMNNVGLFGTGYRDCGEGITAEMAGSSAVSVNSSSINTIGGSLSYSVSVTMPCDFDATNAYELVLYACDRNGDLACFSFNIQFSDRCKNDCGDKSGDKIKSRAIESSTAQQTSVQISPNPAHDQVNIAITYATTAEHVVYIYDKLGRELSRDYCSDHLTLDISTLDAGLYFVKIIDSDQRVVGIQKIVVVQ